MKYTILTEISFMLRDTWIQITKTKKSWGCKIDSINEYTKLESYKVDYLPWIQGHLELCQTEIILHQGLSLR